MSKRPANRKRSPKPRTVQKPATPPAPSPQIEAASLDALDSKSDITVFLSYAHADDTAYQGMTQEFKSLLSHYVYSRSGRKIAMFRDKDDIGWGEIWKSRLSEEILKATIFIPLLSAHYLDSQACRDEFNRFYLAARSVDVPQLILPILILDAPAIFFPTSPDDLVRTAVEIQWEVIEDAVLSDPGSADWKRTMNRIATRFIKSYQSAESALAVLDFNDRPRDPSGPKDDEDDDDQLGFSEILTTLEPQIDALTSAADGIGEALTTFTASTDEMPDLSDNPTPRQIQTWSLKMAKIFKDPSVEVNSQSEKLFTATQELDTTILRFYQLAQQMPVDTGFLESYREMIQPLGDIWETRKIMTDLLDLMKPAESISVPIRQALRPFRQGVTKVLDSFSLIEAWPEYKSISSKPLT